MLYMYIYICCIHLCVCSYFASLWPYFLFKITLAYLSPVSRILTGQPHSNQRLRMVLVLNNKERITNQWIATGWTVPDSLAPRIPQGTQNRTLFFGTSSVRKKQKKRWIRERLDLARGGAKCESQRRDWNLSIKELNLVSSQFQPNWTSWTWDRV